MPNQRYLDAALSPEASRDPSETPRVVPVAWEALEDAFENNAPEVHSYVQLQSGEVIRVIDGIADPDMHARIMADPLYLRVDPVSSREQYRWMERFIATVQDPTFRQRLASSIDGKGAFRRFKDALMNHAEERERWFVFRSERLRGAIDVWLDTHNLKAGPRSEGVLDEGALAMRETPAATAAVSASSPTADAAASWSGIAADGPVASSANRVVQSDKTPGPPAVASASAGASVARTPAKVTHPRAEVAEALRKQAREVLDALPNRDLELAFAFLEFLKDRRHLPRVHFQRPAQDSFAQDRAVDRSEVRAPTPHDEVGGEPDPRAS
jgi:hypothetical protein